MFRSVLRVTYDGWCKIIVVLNQLCCYVCSEVRERLPLIESGGFRPPRIPLTSRRGKRGTSGPPGTVDVAQMARDVIAYNPSGITLQVDHAKEASRLEVEADRLMVEAKLHRVAAKC